MLLHFHYHTILAYLYASWFLINIVIWHVGDRAGFQRVHNLSEILISPSTYGTPPVRSILLICNLIECDGAITWRNKMYAFSPVTFNTVLHRPKKYAPCGSIKTTPTRGEGKLWLIYWRGSKRLENRRTNEQQFVICSGVDDSHLWRDYDLVAISFRLHGLLGDATSCIPKPLVKTIPTFWIILFSGVLLTWAQDWDNYTIT